MKRYVVDEDWNGEEFWNNFKEKIKDCPVEAFKTIDPCVIDSVVLTDDEAEIVDKWINSIDGVKEYCNDYSEGPFLVQDCPEYQELESCDWVAIDENLAIRLGVDGSLSVSFVDTETDDIDWEIIFEHYGLEAEITGAGDGEEDQYLERFQRCDWRLK